MALWLILVGMLTAGMCGHAYLLDALDNKGYSRLIPIFETQSRTQVQCLVTEQFEFELNLKFEAQLLNIKFEEQLLNANRSRRDTDVHEHGDTTNF